MGRTDKPVDRETLYNEVWTDPVTLVAPRYGLSDVGLAKICRSLAIPLPSRGYWAKVKAGRIMGRAPLPKLKEPKTLVSGPVKLPPQEAAIRDAARKSSAKIRKEVSSVPTSEESPISTQHPLIRAASKRLRQREGWPEDTDLRSAPKEVLNLSVTRQSLDRALNLVDALLKTIVDRGFSVEIDAGRGATVLTSSETGTTLQLSLCEHIRRTNHEITPAEERARKKYWERSRWDRSASFPHIAMYDYTAT